MIKKKISTAGWFFIALAIVGGLVCLIMIDGVIGLAAKATQYYSKSK